MTFPIFIFSIIVFFSLSIKSAYAQTPMDLTVLDYKVERSKLKHEVINSFGKGRRNNPKYAKNRGMITTGLTPKFDKNLIGRGIDEYWAMDYSKKRGREAYHGGIDIPAPKGTPILAVASGIVVAKFMNKGNPKGIEIIIRHSPNDIGLSMWVYSQYTHLLEMPDLKIGQIVKLGDIIAKTSNSGISGKEAKRRYGNSSGKRGKGNRFGGVRRNALHFGIFYSNSNKYMNNGKFLVPVDAYWMDPNALYKKTPPYDSKSLKVLSDYQKQILIPCMLESGEVKPKDTKVI